MQSKQYKAWRKQLKIIYEKQFLLIKYRGKSCANFDPELIMLTLSLCDPPCHTQNEKAPDHRTTFHGADVDPLMEEITCIIKYTDL